VISKVSSPHSLGRNGNKKGSFGSLLEQGIKSSALLHDFPSSDRKYMRLPDKRKSSFHVSDLSNCLVLSGWLSLLARSVFS
jgi:hypothetical protein